MAARAGTLDRCAILAYNAENVRRTLWVAVKSMGVSHRRSDMPALSDLLSWMDNKRRVVGRNLSDLVQNPSDYLSMTAANIPQTVKEYGEDPMNFVGGGVGGVIKGRLKIDNPGGEWLKKNMRYSAEDGLNEYGAPRTFGKITGIFSEQQDIPVDVLAKLKGIRGEQSRVRHDDLDWLKKHMDETGQLPLTDSGKPYAPFITIDQHGVPWVNEGNHRIMAAKELGWESLPTEIRYFNGGEAVEGVLSPSRIDAFPPRRPMSDLMNVRTD